MNVLDPSALATAAAAFCVAAASPGPATLATASVAMAHGRRAAFAFGAGLSLGLALWGLVAALGLGAFLLQSATAMTVLRLLGGAYLLYLAWKSAQAAFSAAPAVSLDAGPARATEARVWVRRGFLLNATNPKAVLAWAAVLALGTSSEAGVAQLWAAFAVCATLGAAIYVCYAVAFSVARMRAGYVRARRGVEAASAIFFGAAGARLIAGRAGEAP